MHISTAAAEFVMTAAEWIQLYVAIVLTVTLAAVIWYACEARKQATATRHIAEASLRPVLEQWIEPTPITGAELVVRYRNFGNGPAVDISWDLEPSGQPRRRVGMGTQDVAGTVDFALGGTVPMAVVSVYSDAHGNRWASRLELAERDGTVENGSSSHSTAG